MTVRPCYGQGNDTFQVQFPFNQARITGEAASEIDQLIFKDRLLYGDKLEVLGYTDYVGGTEYNDSLSEQRADNVRAYLVKSGFDKRDIRLCIGKGKIDRPGATTKDGYAPDRKVLIVVCRSAAAAEPVVKRPPPPATTLPVIELTTEAAIDVDQLSVNQAFTMSHLRFENSTPDLVPESHPDLRKLLVLMQEHPGLTIRIEGHVCCQGPAEGMDSPYKNGSLSECRAQAIRNYLVEHGINGNRVQCIGLGNLNPVVKQEVTEEDKVKNRRVEIRVLSK